jgi:hypothetical protein
MAAHYYKGAMLSTTTGPLPDALKVTLSSGTQACYYAVA